jgi:hypothetical protein
MFILAYRNSIEIGVMTVALLSSAVLGQKNGKPLPGPLFAEISHDDKARLDQQRAIVAAAAKRYAMGTLAGTRADLPVLQKMIDNRVFNKSQTYELQCLGVAFGDVLSSELPLRWVMATDEYGTDPTLRFKKTTIQVNALTMISKRIERDEPVDLAKLLRITREQLRRYEQNPREFWR